MKVGLIGGGPRALWAAEELVFLFRRHKLPLTIVCWDPEEPGGGRVYRADQPLCWRLNVRSDIVRTHIGAFPNWLDRNLTRDAQGRETYRGKVFTAEDKVFAPRAVVGDFLRDSWRALVDGCGKDEKDSPSHGGPRIAITHIPSRVVEVHSVDGKGVGNCRIVAADGSEEFVDEALVVTGHAASWDGQQKDFIAAHDHHSLESIPAGADVDIRGMALTFIDVCLALTEGRGGVFVPAGDAAVDVTGGSTPAGTHDAAHPDPVQAGGPAHQPLRYIPSGREPAHLYPYSRSGQLMQVKPDPSSPWVNLEVPGQEEFEKRIQNCADVAEMRAILDEVTDVVMAAARERAEGLQANRNPATDARAELNETAENQVARNPATGARAELNETAENQAARNQATHYPGRQWARGEAWRRIYGAIVDRASYLAPGDLEGFYELGRELEPIAFGPPPVTAKRVDALVAAGIVVLPQGGGEPEGAPTDAIHVDAVIAPPGLQPGTVLEDLVNRGDVHMLPQGGPNIGSDGMAPGTHIAVIGRDVEPRVIGHDTLNRAMHKEIPTWAFTVFNRALDAQAETSNNGRHHD
ncbi:FAD/NAD(P)-binding protein [Corynebacterium auriscanis]|uniref:FAD/NAD(P)-binding protein n=1 Tax=Corynebacterium auriscanis TaxID=99807 RepID=UPI003CF45C92